MATSDHPAVTTDPVQLSTLLQQLVADMADPTIAYLLAAHSYGRTNHPRTRHYPAVFGLQQGQVHNVEVGADFIAFDTQFVRYPEAGEVGHPGPWTDHFRATGPFAQLYQLCRKVLTPAAQAAAQVTYDDEIVIYYDAQTHSRYPAPDNSNQSDAGSLAAGEHPLAAVLKAVEMGLIYPENHYLLNTTSFESPAGPIKMGMLHLQTLITRNFAFTTGGFSCSVLLDP